MARFKKESASRAPQKIREQNVQISSVDFAGLRKQDSNSSYESSLRSNTSGKRSFTRFFSKGKDFSDSKTSTAERAEISTKTKSYRDNSMSSSSRSSIASVTNQNNSPAPMSSGEDSCPDFETNKIHVANSGKPESVRKSFSSTVQRNSLFHRQHSFSTEQSKDASSEHREPHFSGRRGNLQLSSQSSNSVIFDRSAASKYRFTNSTSNSLPEDKVSENTALLEFRRRYMTSADVYLQRYHKAHFAGSVTVSNNYDSHHKDITYQDMPCDDYYETAFADIFELMKPVLVLEGHDTATMGPAEPSKEMSIEDMESFVEERLLGLRAFLKRSHDDKIKEIVEKKNTPVGADDDTCGMEIKGFVAQVTFFFTKCCRTLAEAAANIERIEPLVDFPEFIDGGSSYSKVFALEDYKSFRRNWELIAKAWGHFNSSVRFYLLHIFAPAVAHFEALLSGESESVMFARSINLEKMMLRAFRDTFVTPLLQKRLLLMQSRDYDKVQLFSAVIAAEKRLFGSHDSKHARTLSNCLDILSTCAARDSFQMDDSQLGETLLSGFLRQINLQSR